MKSLLSLIVVIFAVCLPVLAQNNSMVSANIPYSFYVGTREFPAGEYVFKSTDTPGNLLCISTGANSNTRYKMTADIRKTQLVKDSKLVFLNDDGKMVLHQVWIAGDNHVHDILHGTAVRELPNMGE